MIPAWFLKIVSCFMILILLWCSVQFNSVTKLCLTLQPHELQHTRFPCLWISPRICSNSCPLNWWCHPTISSSVIPFSSRSKSFAASGSFPTSWQFPSDPNLCGRCSWEIRMWKRITHPASSSYLVPPKKRHTHPHPHPHTHTPEKHWWSSQSRVPDSPKE